MRIGLHDADRTRFPNLALMKIAAYHRNRGGMSNGGILYKDMIPFILQKYLPSRKRILICRQILSKAVLDMVFIKTFQKRLIKCSPIIPSIQRLIMLLDI